MKAVIFIFSLLLAPTLVYGLEISSPSAFLKESGDSGQSLDFKFSVTNISIADLANKEPSEDTLRTLLIQKLTVCYQSTDCSKTSSQRIPYSESGQVADPSTTLNGYIEISSITIGEDPNNNERYQGLASFVIKLNEGLAFEAGKNISFSYDNGRVQDSVIQKYTSVQDDPKGLALLPQNKALVVSWEKVTSVTYTQTNNKATPLGMRAYLIPLDLLDKNDTATFQSVMTGYDTENAKATDQRFDCQLTVNRADETCSFVCDNDNSAYLTPNVFKDNYSSVNIKTQDNPSANTISYAGLESIEQEFAAVIQYLPDGLRSPKFAQCVYANPIETFSYAQISGAGDPKPGDPRCFIATAAYGSPIGQELDQLRWFRDEILMKRSYGVWLVQQYYRFSPPLAEWIQNHPTARQTVRLLLYPIVGLIKHIR